MSHSDGSLLKLKNNSPNSNYSLETLGKTVNRLSKAKKMKLLREKALTLHMQLSLLNKNSLIIEEKNTSESIRLKSLEKKLKTSELKVNKLAGPLWSLQKKLEAPWEPSLTSIGALFRGIIITAFSWWWDGEGWMPEFHLEWWLKPEEWSWLSTVLMPSGGILILFALIILLHKARIKKLRRQLKDLTHRYETEKDVFDGLSNDISQVTEELTQLKDKREIIESIISLNKLYDADDNSVLDIAESESTTQIITKKQTLIRKLEKRENRDYLKDLSKVNLFLEAFQKQLTQDYTALQNLCDVESRATLNFANQKISDFQNDLNTYKALMSGLVLMISNLVNDNMLDYYKLREIFDKYAVFETNYEKKVIKQLRENGELTSELIDATIESRNQIKAALENIGLAINDVQFNLEWMAEST